MRRTMVHFLLLWVAASLSACAGQALAAGQSAPPPQARVEQSPEEALRARATEFWDARVKGDLVTQYGFLEASAREQMTLTGFVRARGSVNFLSYLIEGVEVAGDQGRVLAKARFRMSLPQVERFGPWTQAAITRWVREGGVWYLKGSQEDAGQPLTPGGKQP